MEHNAKDSRLFWLWGAMLWALCASPVFAQSNDSFNRQSMVAQGEVSEKYPLGIDATLSNSVGIGTFLTGYGNVPSFATSLTLMPHYDLPKFRSLPRMILSAAASINWWWLDSYYTSAFNQRNRFLYSDLSLNLTMPNALEIPSANLSFAPNISVNVPISQLSRSFNRILGLGVGANLNWSASHFSVAWMPSLSGWLYSSPNLTMACGESGGAKPMPPIINPQNSDYDLSQYMQTLVLSRSGEQNADGTCNIVGRQSLGTLSNLLAFGWSPGAHNISVALGWYLSFLRPLEDRPDLTGIAASGQGFSEATMGRIAYSYTIPVDFNLVISGGVLSYQAIFDKQARISFPFFDFVTPGRNQTQFFIQLAAGI